MFVTCEIEIYQILIRVVTVHVFNYCSFYLKNKIGNSLEHCSELVDFLPEQITYRAT